MCKLYICWIVYRKGDLLICKNGNVFFFELLKIAQNIPGAFDKITAVCFRKKIETLYIC